MNRRGDTGEAVQWTMRLLFASLLFWLLVAQIGMLTNFMKTPNHMELSLYQARIISGEQGIFVTEPSTGRILPGVVDLRKLDEATFLAAYSPAPEGATLDDPFIFGARVRLYEKAADIDTDRALKDRYQNEMTETYLPLARAGLTGKGGGLYERHVYPVLFVLKPGETPRPGWLEVEVVKRT